MCQSSKLGLTLEDGAFSVSIGFVILSRKMAKPSNFAKLRKKAVVIFVYSRYN